MMDLNCEAWIQNKISASQRSVEFRYNTVFSQCKNYSNPLEESIQHSQLVPRLFMFWAMMGGRLIGGYQAIRSIQLYCWKVGESLQNILTIYNNK